MSVNKEFILEYAKLIASNPEDVRIEYTEDKELDNCELKLFVSKEDIGKLIGKDGKVVKAMKAFTSGCKAKDNRTCNITVTCDEEE